MKSRRGLKCLLYLAIILFLPLFFSKLHAQNPPKAIKFTVVGLVVDSLQNPLPAVNVVVLNKSNQGTVTDNNGRFVIVAQAGDILEVSQVGYQPYRYTVPVKFIQNFVITLSIAVVAAGEEVVITAYGKKQQRAAVTSSISTIRVEDLRTPTTNLTNALVGQVAGIIGYQPSGQPGLDNSDFFIRGVTTFGFRKDPLILIDNIELTSNDLARLQPDDLESFSILKDASATALYGARGANGVILVTTKRGKMGKPAFGVRLDNSLSTPTKSIKLADPISYMRLYNEAQLTRNPYQEPRYSEDKIFFTQRTLEGQADGNPYVYPAVDWLDLLLKKQSNTSKATMNISGGGEVATYRVSGNYSLDNGMVKTAPNSIFDGGLKFKNYQIRSNITLNLSKITQLSVDLWGNFNDYQGPLSNDGDLATDLYYSATHTSPVLFPAYYAPDSSNLRTQHILFGNENNGQGSGVGFNNPYAQMVRGFSKFNDSRLVANVQINQNLSLITKGLKFSAFFNTTRFARTGYSMAFNPFYYTILPSEYDPVSKRYRLTWLNHQANLPFAGGASGNSGPATEYLDLTGGSRGINSTIQLQGVLDYDRRFQDHGVSATIVINRQENLTPRPDNNDFNAVLSVLPSRNLTYAGKASYNFQSKYFVDFNFGYNGSERFDPAHRFGFFPSVSGAWLLSREKIWETSGLSNIFTMFKFRASYGSAGNDAIGNQRFFYLSNVNLNNTNLQASFGVNNGRPLSGVSINNYPNPDISWERSLIQNLAVEFNILNSVDFIAEYWTRKTKSILQTRNIPGSAGLEAAISHNIGRASSRGLDLTMNYNQRIGKNFQVMFNSNATLSESKYDYFEEPDYGAEYWRFRTGTYIGFNRGYIAERLFVDDVEAAASPTQVFNLSIARGGDIKYRDVNQDGIINSNDMVPIGLPIEPQINYGFGASLNYKRSIDLGFRFVGQARSSLFINPSQVSPFGNPGGAFGSPTQILQQFANDHWSEDNQNLYALYPRLGTSTLEIGNNLQPSTWWLRKGDYLRLKYVELGYRFPTSLVNRILLQDARVYFSATNLFSLTKFSLWDVELRGNGFNYPIQRAFNVGINIQF